MWLDSSSIIYNVKYRLEALIDAGGLLNAGAFILGGDDSPVWQEPRPILNGGAMVLKADDDRSGMLLSMMTSEGDVPDWPVEYRKKVPVGQHVMNALLDANASLLAGVRRLPFCVMGGTDCRTTTLHELDEASAAREGAPFLYHCMRNTGMSKGNLGVVLEKARRQMQYENISSVSPDSSNASLTPAPDVQFVAVVSRPSSGGGELSAALGAVLPKYNWASLNCNELFHEASNQSVEECAQLIPHDTFHNRNQPSKRLETALAMHNSWCSRQRTDSRTCYIAFALYDAHVAFGAGQSRLDTSVGELLLHPGARVVVLERDAKEEECAQQWAQKNRDYGVLAQYHQRGWDIFRDSCVKTPLSAKFRREHSAWFGAVREVLLRAGRPFLDLSTQDLLSDPGSSFDALLEHISDSSANQDVRAAREEMRHAFVKTFSDLRVLLIG
jgi:hypothetical protein